MTIPLAGPLHAQREAIEGLAELGYTDVWSAEAMGVDGLTPLALASVWAPSLRLGTAILPAFTRGPALMAQSIAGLANAAPGRFLAGIGSSSNVIVENWNGIPFDEPFKRTRDLVRFLRLAMTGEKVTEEFDTFAVKGFRLGDVPEQQPPLLVAALRQGMLRLAGREGDGAIVNWLSAEDAADVSGIVRDAAAESGESSPGPEIVARLFVCPSSDREAVLPTAKFAMAAYLNVPVYRAFHEWRGRTDALAEHWELWDAGDRKGALDKIPDSVVDELIIHGSPEECRAHIQRYFDNGITTAALMVMPLAPFDGDPIVDLAPQG